MSILSERQLYLTLSIRVHLRFYYICLAILLYRIIARGTEHSDSDTFDSYLGARNLIFIYIIILTLFFADTTRGGRGETQMRGFSPWARMAVVTDLEVAIPAAVAAGWWRQRLRRARRGSARRRDEKTARESATRKAAARRKGKDRRRGNGGPAPTTLRYDSSGVANRLRGEPSRR